MIPALPFWIIVPAVFLAWVVVLNIAKKILFISILRFVRQTKTPIDDLFVKSADFPLGLLILVSGGLVAEKLLPVIVSSPATSYFPNIFKASCIIAIVLFAERFSIGLIHAYSHKLEILRSSGAIARGIVRVVIFCLGLLVLLDSFGVSVTPVLASLGIGSLAVALALQPTLENFFAGIQIVVDKPIIEGQFVKLESGEEGSVRKIGWRSTWVQTPANNMVIIPNKQLVDSKITNYYYPDTEIAVVIEAGVHYGSDLEQVERIALEVAHQTLQEVVGAVKNFEPAVRFHTFGAYSVDFSVVLRAREFGDRNLLKHEFIKRLHKRFNDEEIVIPYPIEAVNFEQEMSFVKKKEALEYYRKAN